MSATHLVSACQATCHTKHYVTQTMGARGWGILAMKPLRVTRHQSHSCRCPFSSFTHYPPTPHKTRGQGDLTQYRYGVRIDNRKRLPAATPYPTPQRSDRIAHSIDGKSTAHSTRRHTLHNDWARGGRGR